MGLFEMMQQMLADSGLSWLAMDERQLVFLLATPVFIAVFAWEYLKIRHNLLHRHLCHQFARESQ